MAKGNPTPGKVIEFRSARKREVSAGQAKMVAGDSAGRGGFLDSWLKGHEDGQALVRENLSLKERQRRLEAERDSLIPSLSESIIHYGSLIFAIGLLLGLIMSAT